MLPAALLAAALVAPPSLASEGPDPQPRVVQAGQLLALRAPNTPGAIAGEIRGPLLTGGVYRPFAAVEGLDVDAAARAIRLRVPPRESGPIEVRFLTPLPRSRAAQTLVVGVLPPNLRDGIRVDGVQDEFEAARIAGHTAGRSATVLMFDATTMAIDGTIEVEYEAATDSRHVYLRITWEDPTEDREFDLRTDPYARRHDLLMLWLDSNGNGTYEAGEDGRAIFTYLTGSGCLDQRAIDGSGTGGDDSTVDGMARMDYDGATGRYTAELLLPRAADAHGEDADLSPGARVPFNVFFLDGLGTAAVHPRLGGLFGLPAPDASQWEDLPLPPPVPAHYAPPAAPSGGTFVAVSSHEHPKGELYELDPVAGDLVRLTFNDRCEDWVSVAPDGSFVAYGSSSEQTDYAGYEIYTWERATGLETALTSDALLDGHPAIAPDNWTIAFVTFEAGAVDIYTMDRHGGGRVRITNDPVEQNDPEWTKDGALVVKSCEWTGLEQLAVVDLQGAIERRLTDNANSDHDGFVTADGEWVLYERFEGTWPWTLDWNLTNSTPWSIRMVRRDGAAHRLLVLDGLVNWLPVMAPDGTIAHFANTNFNGGEIRLIDRFGVDRGRFLPAHSRVRYMDWK
ncbi:MAG: hypothetical protein AB1726_04015 [Planctomycetota bacterium]